MTSRHLVDQLKEIGFTGRTANAIAYCGLISGPDELRTLPWNDSHDSENLRWRLRTVPGLGPKGIAEIVAFREHGDPRSRPERTVRVAVELSKDQAAALDAWIAKQPKTVSRPEAIRAMVVASLSMMGDD